MSLQLQLATKKKVKIKMAISSPTGFGKTYSALLLAYGITHDWSKIAVIDSENESASLYSDLGKYFTIPMPPPYSVDRFCEAVKNCVDGGIEVIIVDSTYHYWHGRGGLLEYNNSLGGRYQDWAKTNPLYQKWLDTILQTPVHFICTSRKKQAYEMVKVDGKVTVEKKGMEDQIRDGFDYEQTIAFNIINDKHMVEAGKDRTRLFAGKPEFVITPETGQLIKQWCETGIDEEASRAKELADTLKKIKKAKTVDDLKAIKAGASEYVVKHKDIVALFMERFNSITGDFYTSWQNELNGLTTPDQLLITYKKHEATVDGDQKLKEMFKARQEQLEAVPA